MNHQDSERLTIPPDHRPESEQPYWRRDFPIDWPQDNYVSRRDFTKFMVLTSLAFVAGQFWILLQNFLRAGKGRPPLRKIAPVEKIPVGGALVFDYPGKHAPCLLVRMDEDSFVAYDQQCTHLTCPVIPKLETGQLYCPCHVGIFDIKTGRPIAGPPRRALKRVKLEIRGGAVYATGFEEDAI